MDGIKSALIISMIDIHIIINYIWLIVNVFFVLPLLLYQVVVSTHIFQRIAFAAVAIAIIITEGNTIYGLIKYHKFDGMNFETEGDLTPKNEDFL